MDRPYMTDEWQIAANIWNAVRYEADRRGESGQFILTGSSVLFRQSRMKVCTREQEIPVDRYDYAIGLGEKIYISHSLNMEI